MSDEEIGLPYVGEMVEVKKSVEREIYGIKDEMQNKVTQSL